MGSSLFVFEILLFLVVDHFAQFFAWHELGYVTSRNFDRLFGLGVDAGSGFSGVNLERAEAYETYVVFFLESFLDDRKRGIKSLGSLGLGHVGGFCDFANEFDLFHLRDPPGNLLRTQHRLIVPTVFTVVNGF